MKNIWSILAVLALGAATLTSCETYGDPNIEYTSVAPLDGRWICLMYEYNDFKARGESADTLEYVEVWASNTAEGVSDKMWHNMCFPLAPAATEASADGQSIYPYIDALSIKIDADPANLTFSATDAVGVRPPDRMVSSLYGGGTSGVPTSRTVMTGWKATITEATVTRNGWEGASGTLSDKIVYAIEFDHAIYGVSKFMVVGNRYTLWQEDYTYIDRFVDNY